jgi:hypothetical protein
MKDLEPDKYLRAVVSFMKRWPDILDLGACLCVFLLNPANGMAHGTKSGDKSHIAVLEEVRET